MKTWIWHGLSFELPKEWEMLQFSRNPELGRCAWADPEGFRMELAWRRLPSAPAMDLLVATYPQRLGAETGSQVKPRPDEHGWNVWLARDAKASRVHTLRYEASSRYLVEVVFPETAASSPVWKTVISSFEAKASEDTSYWAAFGMAWEAPSSHRFTSCLIQPARAEVEMFGKRTKEKFRFMRLGMVSHWLRDEPQDWLRRRLPDGYKIQSEELLSLRDGRIAAIATGRPRGPAILPWARPPGWAGAVWLEPSDARLYAVERTCRRECDPRSLPDLLHPQTQTSHKEVAYV